MNDVCPMCGGQERWDDIPCLCLDEKRKKEKES